MAVTLVTGDRVVFGGRASRNFRVVPPPGRENMRFVVTGQPEDLSVVPSDALALLGSGRVDRRLFNVDTLVRQGLDDAHSDRLSLTVHKSGTADTVVGVSKNDLQRFWEETFPGAARSVSSATRVRLSGLAPDVKSAPAYAGAVEHKVTLRHLDRQGQDTADYFVAVYGYDDDAEYFPYDPSGTVTFTLPEGRYSIGSFLTGAAGDMSLVAQPWVDLRQDLTVTVDARSAQPVDVTVPNAKAMPMFGSVQYHAATVGSVRAGLISGNGFDNLFAADMGAAAPVNRFVAEVSGSFGVPGADGFFTDSPFRYSVAFARSGEMWNGLQRHLAPADLATVVQRYPALTPDRVASHDVVPDPDALTVGIWISYPITMTSGASRTEYFAGTGVRWHQTFTHNRLIAGVWQWEGDEESPPTAYAARASTSLRWGTAVVGPAFRHDGLSTAAARSGNVLDVRLPLFSPGLPGFSGFTVLTAGGTVLSRDGQVIGTSPDAGIGRFDVPPDTGVYHLQAHAIRISSFRQSTELDAAWTFKSGPVAGAEPNVLPLLAVRFGPQLDDLNQAPPGRTFDVPVWVEWQPPTVSKVVALTVAVSYDDGARWQDAPLTENAGGWVAHLDHPPTGVGSGHVSLRTRAVDANGTIVEETIIRAYALSSR
jgi:hypothetical protein